MSSNPIEFEDFLLKEYENIASAHFESQKQFALFFRYYILFFSVPFIVASINKNDNKIITPEMFGFSLLVLSLIGLFFYRFAISLKYEAVLYARTVNGIRNFFYKKLANPSIEKEILTLPKSIDRPPYESYFNPVLLIISIVNVTYFFTGLIYTKLLPVVPNIAASLIFFAIHFIFNWHDTKSHKKRYP